MQLSRTPDLAPWRRMALAALAAAVVAMIVLAFRDGPDLPYRLGDTDDAMRIVMMRALAAGQGWFDQKITRLQPPYGVYMHWSRLIDGGLAVMDRLFRLGLSPAMAELATRFTWPLLWIVPVTLAATATARRLGGGAAVFACAIILAIDMPLFLQFRPGRVDHHNVQITLCMLALAGAALGKARGAALAGFATGLGIAIGLEALIFEVLIGAYFALRYPLGDKDDGRALRAYAVALGAATVGFFLIQTPPWRWGVVACDAVAINLVAAITVVGVGLTATVALTRKASWQVRLGALAVVGVIAAALYVGLDRNCLGGPFADVDPRLKVFWLPNVQEIRPVTRVWLSDHDTVFTLIAPMVWGALAWLWLIFKGPRRRDGFTILAGVCLLAGSVAGWNAIRMAGYANWFAVPLIAAAVAGIVERHAKGAMLITAAAACAATPMFAGSAAGALDKQIKAASAKPPAKSAKPAARPAKSFRIMAISGDRCFHIAAYAALARQPAGLVLTEVDLGPFILAHTASSSMTAPYHRMSWGLVQARAALSTPAEMADVPTRKLGATYVLECPTHARNSDRVGMVADSLQKRLDRNQPPAWLEPLSTGGALRLYRVRPSATAPTAAASAKH
jgi:hypothetical protein